jgi:hypothetical protein
LRHVSYSITQCVPIYILIFSFYPDLPSGYINGLYNLEEPNFFREGRTQFDREIKQLYDQSLAEPDKVLKVSPEIQRTLRQLTPFESDKLLHPSK